jgi:Protein of unknown function (DUF3014)
MTDFLDRDLDADFKTRRPYISPPPRRSGGWVAIALLIVAIGGGFYYFVTERRVPPKPVAVTPTPTQAPPRAAPPRALGADAEPLELPPLDETDPIVQERVGALSNNPTVAAWLATSGLIRNVTRVVQAIAEDRGVARHLAVVRPSQPFSVQMSGGRMIDSRSYRRYDAIAAAVGSLDPRASATLYSTFRPRISEAYAELGFPNTPFDATLEDALVTLVSTPVPDGPIEVTPRGGTYAFADPRLEALAPAQKQLLRMGPENARAMKAKLREIAIALGVPAERLPQ